MTRRFAGPALALLLSAGSLPPAPARAASLGELQDSFAELAAKAKPAVVHITTVQEETVRLPQFFFGDPDDFFYEFFHGRPQRPRTFKHRMEGAGTGFILDPDGFILTNEHVVRGANEIKVVLTAADGKETSYAGKVIGKAVHLDLAVVKIQGQAPFPHLTLGDSARARVGDWAIAIGSPFALGQTVTVGVISAVRQSLIIEGRRYPNIIQTDAAINRGNSGGPLLNLKGEVIGINTAIYSPSGAFAGIGFAITIDEAKTVLSSLIAGKSIKPGWLGIEVGPVDPVMQKRFGLPDAAGALVNGVLPGSPAAKAGLRRGDVIRKMGVETVGSPEDLVRLTMGMGPGSKVRLEFVRDGKALSETVKLAERPEAAPDAGPERRPPSAEPEGAWRWEGVDFEETRAGVSVAEVSHDSNLFGYLMPGDQVRGVDQTETPDLPSLQAALKGAKLADGIVFDVVRDGQPMYISVQIGR